MRLGIHLPQYGPAASAVTIREAAIRRAIARGDGCHAINTSPDDLAPTIERLRAQRPEDAIEVSYRTGWDPQGMDPSQIVDEVAAYSEVGVSHVVAAPWRTDLESWIESMEQLVDLVQPES